MSTNYPSGLDIYITLVDNVDAIAAAHINNPSNAIEALEAKLGVDSSGVSGSIDYFLQHASGAYRLHKHDGTSDDGASVIGPLTGLTIANNVDVGNYRLKARTFQSDVATGYAPLMISSTTVVTNLNADTLDGSHVSDITAPFGSWVSKEVGEIYLAATDGFVTAWHGGYPGIHGYTDSDEDPSTIRTRGAGTNPGMMMPVRKGDYWKILCEEPTTRVWWLPLGS